MRFDALGLFWEDHAPVKPPKKEKVKAIPPDPIWLLPTYLPGLQEALAMRPNLLSPKEIVAEWQAGNRFTFDIESYPNWWFIAFKSTVTGGVIFLELIGENNRLDYDDQQKLKWLMENLKLVGFNSRNFDVPETAIAMNGVTCGNLYNATRMIIEGIDGPPLRPHIVLKKFGVKKVEGDHIDVIELVKLRPSLKICAGRLHAQRMQDLPFVPGTILTDDQIMIGRWYCINDLDNTELLYKEVKPQIELRELIGKRYGIDVRSRSDAQIAEDLLSVQIKKRTGLPFLSRTMIEPGTSYKYNVPRFIKFESQLLNHVLKQVVDSDFVISPGGKVLMPKQLKDLKVDILQTSYQMGIGGLHSTEKNRAVIADEEYFVKDRDVTSYYPRIILNLGLAPTNLGHNFISEYRIVVEERVRAKERGDTVLADTYKIVANGSFGKFGSKWSILYAPQLLIQTTITGQLSLFMLIERLEMAGFSVMSANTDGIVTRGLRTRVEEFNSIVAGWERDTGFTTEELDYKALYSRDVNNYMAVYEKPQKGKLYKGKGVFSEVPLDKNPMTRICFLSAIDHIIHGTDYRQMIAECKDLTKFTAMQKVKGGAYKDGVYLGKAIRWYWATGIEGIIVNAKNGNKIPRTEGAKPCMTLPESFPDDLDLLWYQQETTKILKQIGYNSGEVETEDEDDEVEADSEPDEIIIED